MDQDNRYFFVTTNFLPAYDNEFIHIEGEIYQHKDSGKTYRRRLLYDFGWGQEPGYECVPALSFCQLIQLITYRRRWTPLCFISKKHRDANKLHFDNFIGAVSVIMQDHQAELIEFLKRQVETDFFDNPYIRRQFQWFSVSEEQSVKLGYLPTGIGNTTFAKILDHNPAWMEISENVIRQVYR